MNGPQDSRAPGLWDDDNEFLPNSRDNLSEPGGEDEGGRRLRPFIRLLLTLLVLAGVVYALNMTLMKIRHVSVEGNLRISAADIAALAGLDKETTLLTVNENAVRRGVESSPYLEFQALVRVFPDTLVLKVRERAACAHIQGAGALYLVDEFGFVLASNPNIHARYSVPLVFGVNVAEAVPGRLIVSNQAGKVDEYSRIMQELLLQGVAADIEEINLTNSEHIYLQMRCGYYVNIGTAQELMMKIGLLRAVVAKLGELGHATGYIDVSIPGEAVYSPE